jgi:hypothetical protein
MMSVLVGFVLVRNVLVAIVVVSKRRNEQKVQFLYVNMSIQGLGIF